MVLVGVFGGYEDFSYTSQSLNGILKGNGWTVGGYFGWLLTEGLRFNASVARSGIDYNGVAGTASGVFPGQRWFASAALIGMYKAWGLEFEPSAKVFALWEREDAYTDSLGTSQAERTFSTGRASAGVKVAYPWAWSAAATVSPYVGLYGDFYFNTDDASALVAPGLQPTQFLHGWSARVTTGLGMAMTGGAQLSVASEVGGLGSGQFINWTLRGRAMVPF